VNIIGTYTFILQAEYFSPPLPIFACFLHHCWLSNLFPWQEKRGYFIEAYLVLRTDWSERSWPLLRIECRQLCQNSGHTNKIQVWIAAKDYIVVLSQTFSFNKDVVFQSLSWEKLDVAKPGWSDTCVTLQSAKQVYKTCLSWRQVLWLWF